MWRAPGPDGPWTRTDLPGDGSLGEAHSATCDEAGRCTVVGEVDGTLRGWALAGDDTVTPLGLPTLAVGEHDLLPAPLLRGEESTVLLASGGVLRMLDCEPAASAAAAAASGDGIRQWTGRPARAVRSAARTATGDYVVLEDPSGAARLVRLTAP